MWNKIKFIISLNPQISADCPTDNISDEIIYAGLDKPITRLRRLVRNIRVFLLGTATETIRRPSISSADCFWILINLHVNIRFIARYIDLSLEWGGFLVWTVYSLTNLTICSCLGSIYTFLGSYGDRSYLRIWDMLPMFEGIAYSVTIVESLKIMETSLILSSGLMSFNDIFNYKFEANSASSPIKCNKTKHEFEPAVGVPYGLSQVFTAYGQQYTKLGTWEISNRRAWNMLYVYLCVIFFRLFTFKRYRYYPLRVNSVMLMIMVALLITMNSIWNERLLGKIIQYEVEKYTNVHAYLQIILFTIAEYMPMHWINIGFLCPQQTLTSKIWVVAAFKILFSFFILYWIPFVAGDFMLFTNVERSECLQFFGTHFIFIMVPAIIKMHLFTDQLFTLVYVIYFILMFIHGLSYILVSIELFQYSFVTSQRILYRYRNIMYILFCIIMACISYPFCITNNHYFLFYLNTKSHFFTLMILLTLTTLALSIYGLQRISGDYLFMKGVFYANISSLKVLFLFNFGLVLIFLSEAYFYDYRLEDNHYAYWIILGICLSPLLYGIWRTNAFKTRLHGLFQPMNRWGMPSASLRNQRRRRTLHTMYTYRMKRDCTHNCLIENPTLLALIERNLDAQEANLGLKRINKLRLLMDRKSRESENT